MTAVDAVINSRNENRKLFFPFVECALHRWFYGLILSVCEAPWKWQIKLMSSHGTVAKLSTSVCFADDWVWERYNFLVSSFIRSHDQIFITLNIHRHYHQPFIRSCKHTYTYSRNFFINIFFCLLEKQLQNRRNFHNLQQWSFYCFD